MICPRCEVPMTRHAAKIVYPQNAADEVLVDPELGGVVLERHQCPECGEGASERARPRSDGGRK